MNPVSTIRISLLLRQSRLKKFSDPSRLNCCWRIAIHRESRQTRRAAIRFSKGLENDPVVLVRSEAGQYSCEEVPSLRAEPASPLRVL